MGVVRATKIDIKPQSFLLISDEHAQAFPGPFSVGSGQPSGAKNGF